MLQRNFYLKHSAVLARELIGKKLVHKTPEGISSGVIVETEAYSGVIDDGAHAYPNRMTQRTRIMFGPGGFAYVYFIYGMYNCFNITANLDGIPEAVLIRALEPLEGVDLMQKRRQKCSQVQGLCNGPGKLCQAMAITREHYGIDLAGDTLFLEDCKSFSPEKIEISPRINIDYAENCRDWLWRFFVKDSSFVSKVPKRYHTGLTVADLW